MFPDGVLWINLKGNHISFYITLMGKTKMNEADFKQYVDQELNKCQRYKQVWKLFVEVFAIVEHPA